MKSFNNKTAFITGGASGIGLGMARAFGEQGMSLAIADIDETRLQSAKTVLEQSGYPLRTYVLDVTDRNAVSAAVAEAREAFGSINVVCANAGVSGLMGPLEKASVQEWDWVIDVNLKGAAYLVQTCMPYLLENPDNAHIVITSSISGLRVYEPSRGQGMYNTTKYGLVGMGEALKVDMQPHGIGVSILCPGVVNTRISHSGKNRPEKYGGAYDTDDNHELAKAADSGTDPLQMGRWVVKAIERNQLYVITHPGDRDLVAQRHQKILQAFDDSPDLTSD